MASWFVKYKFKNSDGQWVEATMYIAADSPEMAKASVVLILEELKLEHDIVSVRMVGEGR
jgi:hypothetical protein